MPASCVSARLHADENDLIKNEGDWGSWWLQKSSKRTEQLSKNKKISNDILFNTGIDEYELQMWLQSRGGR